MEGYILFYFTDGSSTFTAPKGDLRINFTKHPDEIVDKVNLLELKLRNVLVVKLNEPTTIKEINSWLNQFQKVLKKIGIDTKTALPIPDSINSTECKTRFHPDDTIGTIRYEMQIFM